MNKYAVRYEHQVKENLRHLHPTIKSSIKSVVRDLQKNPFLGKLLQDEFYGFRSTRHQRWRIIYSINPDEEIITLHLIERRLTVYETLKTMDPPLKFQEPLAPYGRSASPTKP